MMLAAMLMTSAPADTTISLNAVTVTGQQHHEYQMRSSQSEVQVSHEFLQQNFSGSLMQTLEAIPGVKAMAIGSGQSKPVIYRTVLRERTALRTLKQRADRPVGKDRRQEGELVLSRTCHIY